MGNKPYIIAIDPGNKESAYCLCSPDLKPLAFAKLRNVEGKKQVFWNAICDSLSEHVQEGDEIRFVIEDMQNFGMPVGRSVLDTEKYIGYLTCLIETNGYAVDYVFRNEEKLILCHSMKANDATIKQALIDRFAPDTSNHGKGTKACPGFFYGMKNDCWSAFAQCVTFHDREYGSDLHLEELPF